MAHIWLLAYFFLCQGPKTAPGIAGLDEDAASSLATDDARAEPTARRLASTASVLRSRPISINFRTADGAMAVIFPVKCGAMVVTKDGDKHCSSDWTTHIFFKLGLNWPRKWFTYQPCLFAAFTWPRIKGKARINHWGKFGLLCLLRWTPLDKIHN